MSFNPCNLSLKIWESIGTPTPKMETHLGVWGVHSLTLSYIPESMKWDSQASFLACTFVSPYFGREPKTKVAIFWKLYFIQKSVYKSSYYH
jgi:hypothetical protein